MNFVKVRAYNWNRNENQINDNTLYNAQDVSEIINYPQNNPRFPRKKLNNLAAVILSQPLNVNSLFELANKTNADLNNCAIIDSDEEINDEGKIHTVKNSDLNKIHNRSKFTPNFLQCSNINNNFIILKFTL